MRSHKLLLLALVVAAFAVQIGLAQETANPGAAPLGPLLVEQGNAPSARIGVGDTVSGQLTPEQPSVFYTFAGQRGQLVAFTMTSGEVDSYLRLGDEAGALLVSDDDSASQLNARIGPVPIPRDGTYLLAVSSFQNVVSEGEGADLPSGAFTLSVTSYEASPVRYSARIRGELTQDGDNLKVYSFKGEAGDVVSLNLESRDFDTFLLLSSAETLANPLVVDDDDGDGQNSRIPSFILPGTATYLVTATSYGPGQGGFRLEINQFKPIPIAYGNTVIRPTSKQYPILVSAFDGEQGDIVDAIVDAPAVDTTLTLLGPDGAQIAFEDDNKDLNPALAGFELPADGTYIVVVQPFVQGTYGTVRLSLTKDREPEP